MISDKAIGRLSLYRRLLRESAGNGEEYIFSHELAALAGCTPAQVRRDVMAIGYSGSPAKGYDVQGLISGIGAVLDPRKPVSVILMGVGNLGRAILSYFGGRTQQYTVLAAFDTDPEKANRVIHGCRCYPLEQLIDLVKAQEIREAIIAVPASEAQATANLLCEAGIRGIVNFAPLRLWVPKGVYVENVDMAMTLERVVYFSREGARAKVTG